MNKEFLLAIEDIGREKGISHDILIDAIEAALVSAYKKNYGTTANVRVNIDRETGEFQVYNRRTVVEEVTNDITEISLEDAKEIDMKFEEEDIVEKEVTPKDFGRIAAQTAKQVVVQRIREAERGIIYDDFSNKQSEIVTGIVQRTSNGFVFINLGKTEGILAPTEQVPGEKYEINKRVKVFIMDVKKSTKGPQVYVSRSHPGLVKRLFELEVPEIHDGIVEIKSISREAGSRTKLAVFSTDENVDAVGACVGPKGARVQVIVDELFGEKIDIINWSESPEEFIKSSLSPATVESVKILDDDKSAVVIVPEYQLSLAIGREGQNVRLAAKLTNWRIDIKIDKPEEANDVKATQSQEAIDDIDSIDDTETQEDTISEIEEIEE